MSFPLSEYIQAVRQIRALSAGRDVLLAELQVVQQRVASIQRKRILFGRFARAQYLVLADFSESRLPVLKRLLAEKEAALTSQVLHLVLQLDQCGAADRVIKHRRT